MKNSYLYLTIFLLALSLKVASQPQNDLNKVRKEIANHTRAVHLFDDWMRDPFITIGPDGDYYLTMTQHGDTIDGRLVINHGAPLYKSKDLAEWTFEGYYYDISKDATNYNDYLKHWEERSKHNGNSDPLKLWAPEVHFINGKWHVLHTSNSGLGNLASTMSDKLEGPYKGWNENFAQQHDPTLFHDDDGSVWLVSRCTQIQKLKDDLSCFDGEPIQIGPSNRKMGHEGAFIIKHSGKYVLFGTAWSTDTMRHGTYNLYYCTSDKLEGPYNERKFAGRYLGHGTPFVDKEGRWWCTAFYNANAPALDAKKTKKMDLSETAYTINKQGLTLVPLEIRMVNGDVEISAKDKAYRYPGKEEVQKF